MRRKLFCIILLICSIFPTIQVQAKPIELYSESAVLIDANTGQVLYEKDKDEKKFPASITKIMSGIVSVEKGNLSDVLTVSETAVNSISRTSSHIFLVDGEQLSFQDALYAMMLASGNDAAATIAEYIGGTIDGFVDLMNKKAQELGMVNSHFTNPHGLPNDSHYTTPYDMAILTRYAIQNPTFYKVFSTVTYEMAQTNKSKEIRYFAAGNEMFKPSAYKYEYAKAGKTGYTADAGYTLVTVAEKDGVTLIAVVMKSGMNQRYKDSTALFEYGFSLYENKMISKDNVSAIEKDITIDPYRKVIAKVSVNEDIIFPGLKDININDIKVEFDTTLLTSEENQQAYALVKYNEFVLKKIPATVILDITQSTWKNVFLYYLSKIGIVVLSFVGIIYLFSWIQSQKKNRNSNSIKR